MSISAKVRKANAIVGLIRRTFSFLDCRMFKKLYTTFVRPHLEYAQAVWSPHLKKNINILENVQIRATKIVDGLANLDYPERLEKLDLPTLVYRRARGDMIEVFKHFHTYDRKILPRHFCRHDRPSRIHDHQLVTIKQSSKLVMDAKERYFSKQEKKLLDPSLGAKKYWSIFNNFLQKKNISIISPL